MTICPYCEQSSVAYVRLKSHPSIVFQMCFECDSVWKADASISNDSGTNFVDFISEFGLTPDWDDVFFIKES